MSRNEHNKIKQWHPIMQAIALYTEGFWFCQRAFSQLWSQQDRKAKLWNSTHSYRQYIDNVEKWYSIKY